MKGLLVFLAVALIVGSVSADYEPGLKARFGLGNPFNGEEFFFNIPRNFADAINYGWIRTEAPEGSYPGATLYCRYGPRNCDIGVFMDEKCDRVVGQIIAFDKSRFSSNLYDWAVQGYRSWSAKTEDGVVDYYYTAFYFVSEDYFKEPRQECTDSKEILQENAVFATGFHHSIDRIPANQEEITETLFTEQACVPWMGHHFYYNMSETTTCESDTMYPWFPLYVSKKMVGIGHNIMGKYVAREGDSDCHENPAAEAVKMIVNKGPQCLYDQAVSPGIVTMHTYFIKDPQYITCLFQ